MGKPAKYDFSGWATKANVKCSDGRTILKHAFKECDGKTVPLVWNHNHTDAENVLGHALLENREEGVYAYCSFNDTPKGKQAKELVQHKDICALSIYANQLKQNGSDVIHGNIREVSLVLAGANPGAFIENVVMAHSDDGNEVASEATIYNEADENSIEMFHAEEDQNKDPENKDPKEKDPALEHKDGENKDPENKDPENKDPENKVDPAIEHKDGENKDPKEKDPALEHKDKEKKDPKEKTVQDVIDSMNEEQKEVLYLLVGVAHEEAKNAGGNVEMKHNLFEGLKDKEGNELQHSEFVTIIADAKKHGSLKEEFLAHGITGIENLFPEAQNANRVPEMVSRDMGWVKKVMGSVHHTPFSRVKSTYANITADEARAKGYVKGNKKVEEVIAAFKRKVDPQTVYKLQKFDRDDIIDITDFDVVAWIKVEMRMMLEEELARAILIGDGRGAESNDKIDPLHIVPVWQDNSVYTVNKQLEPKGQEESDEAFAKRFIKAIIKSRKDYKGSGNPVLYTTEDMLTNMLLIEDLNQRVIYDTEEKLKTALRVSAIVTVPVMEGATRSADGHTYSLLGLLVNLADYNVGADKGGQVALFDDFDIDYNKYEYLIETRMSGALVKPYSAISFEVEGSF